MADECPELLPCVGSDPAAKLALTPVRSDTEAGADGSVKPSQAEWVIEVKGISPSQTADDIVGLLFEPLQKCRTPVSIYGLSENFNTWRKLPDVVIVGDEDDDVRHSGGDAMDEDGADTDEDDEVDSGDEGGDEWMDDDDDTYSSLLFGVWLVSDAQQNDRQLEIMDAKALKRAQTVITSALKPLRPRSVTARTDPTEGAARARAIADCVPLCDVHVAIMLRPLNRPAFDPAVVFDSLLSIGMQYQPRSRQFVFRGPVVDVDGCPQVDDLFMVVPSYGTPGTPGALQIESLKVGFFVPYTPEPLTILNNVIAAAEYVARRQGGALVYDEAGTEGPENVFREAARAVQEVAGVLKQMGISAGSTHAQMLY